MPSLKQKRGTYRNVGANPIGAFINKDKVEGGRLSDRGRLLEGERQNESLRYLYCSIKIIAIKPTRLCISVELLEKGLSGAKEFGSRDRYDGTFSKRS